MDVNVIMCIREHLQKCSLIGADSQASTQCRTISLMRLCDTHNEMLAEEFQGEISGNCRLDPSIKNITEARLENLNSSSDEHNTECLSMYVVLKLFAIH